MRRGTRSASRDVIVVLKVLTSDEICRQEVLRARHNRKRAIADLLVVTAHRAAAAAVVVMVIVEDFDGDVAHQNEVCGAGSVADA